MRRKDREVIEHSAVEAILRKAVVCRIGLCDGDKPYLVPVHFGFSEGCLYIHSAPEGKKIELIRKNNRVCFEMETDVKIVPAKSPCNWTTVYASVIGFGRATIVADAGEKRAGLEVVFRHYSDAPFDVPEEALEKIVVIRIDIDSLTAKASGFPDVLHPQPPESGIGTR